MSLRACASASGLPDSTTWRCPLITLIGAACVSTTNSPTCSGVSPRTESIRLRESAPPYTLVAAAPMMKANARAFSAACGPLARLSAAAPKMPWECPANSASVVSSPSCSRSSAATICDSRIAGALTAGRASIASCEVSASIASRIRCTTPGTTEANGRATAAVRDWASLRSCSMRIRATGVAAASASACCQEEPCPGNRIAGRFREEKEVEFITVSLWSFASERD